MHVEEKDGTYFLSGDMDESVRQSFSWLPSGRARFDLRKIRIVNSYGIRDWLWLLMNFNVQPTYLNCPEVFVIQLNMLASLLHNEAIVESIQVPCVCSGCKKEWIFIAKNETHFAKGRLPQFKLKPCASCGATVEPDVELDSYFFFVNYRADL